MNLYPSTLSIGGPAFISATAPVANQLSYWEGPQTVAGNKGFLVDVSNVRVYVSDGATGGTPQAAPTGGFATGTNLVLDNRSAAGDDTYLAIVSGASGTCGIHFGDTNDADRGAITYAQATDTFTFTTATGSALTIFAALGTAHLFAGSGTQTTFVLQNYHATASTGPEIIIQRGRASGAAVQNGDVIGKINYCACDNAGMENNRAEFDVYADENHTATAHGTRFELWNVRNTTTTLKRCMTIDNRSYVAIGDDTPANPLFIKGDHGATYQLALYNESTTDGRCGISFTADRGSTFNWVLGMDLTGGTTKSFHLRDATTGVNLFQVVDVTGKVGIGVNIATPASQVEINTATDIGDSVLGLQQDDDNEPFVSYDGTTEAGSTKSISSWTTGGAIQGFVRVDVNGADYWMPFYSAPTS